MGCAMLLAILATTVNAQRSGRHYFVTKSGSDANVGTESKPFATIQKAVEVLRPSDTLTISGGTYKEAVKLTRSGNYFGRQITIEGRAGEDVVLDGTGLSAYAVFDTGGADHLILRNIQVAHGSQCGIAVVGSWNVELDRCASLDTAASGFMIDKSHKVVVNQCEIDRGCQRGGEESVSVKRSVDVTVRETHIHHTGHEGIDVKEGSKHVLVERCHIHDVERQGMYAEAWDSDTFDIRFDRNHVHDCMMGVAACTESGGLLKDVWFTNNLIHDIKGPGMIVAFWGNERMTHRIKNLYFLNNTVVNCGNGGRNHVWGGGMHFAAVEADNVVVANNILSGCPQGQFFVHEKMLPTHLVIENNLIHGPGASMGVRTIQADPQFVDAAHGDFRLRPTSPAKGKGVARPDIGSLDFGGSPRKVRSTVDIGAFQSAP